MTVTWQSHDSPDAVTLSHLSAQRVAHGAAQEHGLPPVVLVGARLAGPAATTTTTSGTSGDSGSARL